MTESFTVLQYGGSNWSKKNQKVYQTKQVPGFSRLYNTDTNLEEIYRYEDNKLQDGGFRAMFNGGHSCIGQRKFAKSRDDGEESREYRLLKYVDGDIEYKENIKVGRDKGWKTLTEYKFNPDKLEWNKNDL